MLLVYCKMSLSVFSKPQKLEIKKPKNDKGTLRVLLVMRNRNNKRKFTPLKLQDCVKLSVAEKPPRRELNPL